MHLNQKVSNQFMIDNQIGRDHKTQENRFLLIQPDENKFFNQSHINSYDSQSLHRTAAENFIRDTYQQHYQADIDDFYPHLLTLETPHHQTEQISFHAIAGLRCATEQDLFAEYYLSHSMEQTLSELFKQKLPREGIIEIGNLALQRRKNLRWLIIALVSYLYSANFQQVVFTAIPVIANSFKRIAIPLYELANASIQQLPKALQKQWGADYYRLSPKVYAIDIQAAYEVLCRQLDALNPILKQFCQRAFYLGSQHYKVAQVA